MSGFSYMQPGNSLQPKKKASKIAIYFHVPKSIIILFIILLIVIIIGMMYYILNKAPLQQRTVVMQRTNATQSPHIADRSNLTKKTAHSPANTNIWTTYTDPNGAYTFQYPSLWNKTIEPATMYLSSGPDVNCTIQNTCKKNAAVIDFNVFKLKYTLSLAAYAQQILQQEANSTPPISITYTTFDGLNAIAIIEPGSQVATSVSYYVINKRVAYLLEYEASLPLEKRVSLNELPPVTPDIAATFKFTN